MSSVDCRPDISDVEKLRYLYAAMGGNGAGEGQDSWGVWSGSVEVQQEQRGTEPYILVSSGNEFADSLDAYFFAKTFPTLFPFSRGVGVRQRKALWTVRL
ncbi:hypothetical protein K469DRAFT_703096, partial [Zopfia rhizophila CBS 207.26]